MAATTTVRGRGGRIILERCQWRSRYIPFFMIAALPVIGTLLSAERLLRWGRSLLVAGSVALVAFSMRDNLPSREQVRLAMRVNENAYPVRAADFVLATTPKGNLL
jgi:hypothetical protein